MIYLCILVVRLIYIAPLVESEAFSALPILKWCYMSVRTEMSSVRKTMKTKLEESPVTDRHIQLPSYGSNWPPRFVASINGRTAARVYVSSVDRETMIDACNLKRQRESK